MELLKFDVEVYSNAMMYIPSFVKIGSNIQMLIGGIHKHTVSMEIAIYRQIAKKKKNSTA
jgi:hypothetical protein